MEINNRESAQAELDRLIKVAQQRALWFFKPLQNISISDREAGIVLEKISANCSRDEWIKTRKLIKWRLQNIK